MFTSLGVGVFLTMFYILTPFMENLLLANPRGVLNFFDTAFFLFINRINVRFVCVTINYEKSL